MAFSEIAWRLGVSPGMVRQRYQRLVENRVAGGFDLVAEVKKTCTTADIVADY